MKFTDPYRQPFQDFELFSNLMNEQKYFQSYMLCAEDSKCGTITILRQHGRDRTNMLGMGMEVTKTSRSIISKSKSGEKIILKIQQNTWTAPANTPPAMPDWKVIQDVVMVPSTDERFNWQVETFEEDWQMLSIR